MRKRTVVAAGAVALVAYTCAQEGAPRHRAGPAVGPRLPPPVAEAVQLGPSTSPGDTLTVVGAGVRVSHWHNTWRETFASLAAGTRVVVLEEFVSDGQLPVRRIKVRALNPRPVTGWVHAADVGVGNVAR